MATVREFTEVRWSEPGFHEDKNDYDVLYRGSAIGAWWYWLLLGREIKVFVTRARVREVEL